HAPTRSSGLRRRDRRTLSAAASPVGLAAAWPAVISDLSIHSARRQLYILLPMALPLTKGGSPPSSGNGPSADPFDGTEHYFSDFYHHLITSSWPLLLLQIAIAFVVANSLFAVGYYLDGGVENA